MYDVGKIEGIKVDKDGTRFIILVKDIDLSKLVLDKRINTCGLWFNDGRSISPEQRKKIYATVREIADYTGYDINETKELMKCEHIVRTGCKEFSLSNCSMDLAREFLDTMIEYCLVHGVQMQESGLERTSDIEKYLWLCMKHKKCCICGRDGETHHVDAIGMGHDRTSLDDDNHRKICLCRNHHTETHKIGRDTFFEKYKVHGVLYAGGEE